MHNDATLDMRKSIDQDLLKEWKFALKNDWVTVYCSSFGGQVSYEKDGVLTLSFNEFADKDYFEGTLNTSDENLMVKLKYAMSVLSKFYYHLIDKKEYDRLLTFIQ